MVKTSLRIQPVLIFFVIFPQKILMVGGGEKSLEF